MTEHVNFSATSVTPTIDTATHTSHSASQKKESGGAVKTISRQTKPDIAITEVAGDAAAVRSDSLNSINEVTEELREAISTLNAALEKTKTRAIITRDEEINRFIVRITDEQSGETVREIPNEAILKFSRNLQALKGLIFDKTL